MTKELEVLKKVKFNYFQTNKYADEDDKKWFDIIEKSLKALEIIKEKKVDIDLLFYCFTFPNNNYKTYNENNERKWLKREEYDLLKEVLL